MSNQQPRDRDFTPMHDSSFPRLAMAPTSTSQPTARERTTSNSGNASDTAFPRLFFAPSAAQASTTSNEPRFAHPSNSRNDSDTAFPRLFFAPSAAPASTTSREPRLPHPQNSRNDSDVDSAVRDRWGSNAKQRDTLEKTVPRFKGTKRDRLAALTSMTTGRKAYRQPLKTFHEETFTKLLSPIPAQYYISDTPEEADTEWMQNKKKRSANELIETRKKAKFNKFDPSNNKTIPEIQAERAVKAADGEQNLKDHARPPRKPIVPMAPASSVSDLRKRLQDKMYSFKKRRREAPLHPEASAAASEGKEDVNGTDDDGMTAASRDEMLEQRRKRRGELRDNRRKEEQRAGKEDKTGKQKDGAFSIAKEGRNPINEVPTPGMKLDKATIRKSKDHLDAEESEHDGSRHGDGDEEILMEENDENGMAIDSSPCHSSDIDSTASGPPMPRYASQGGAGSLNPISLSKSTHSSDIDSADSESPMPRYAPQGGAGTRNPISLSKSTHSSDIDSADSESPMPRYAPQGGAGTRNPISLSKSTHSSDIDSADSESPMPRYAPQGGAGSLNPMPLSKSTHSSDIDSAASGPSMPRYAHQAGAGQGPILDWLRDTVFL